MMQVYFEPVVFWNPTFESYSVVLLLLLKYMKWNNSVTIQDKLTLTVLFLHNVFIFFFP